MTSVSVEQVRSAGVVGAGGAGFPTHVKLAGKADTVLLNAAECEPLFHKDKEVLREFAGPVLAGLADAMRLVGAGRGVVGIKEKYGEVIEVLRPLLPGGIEICPLRDCYPAGDEFILVYDVLGRVIPPGGIPPHVDAAVINVETALNVALAGERPVTEKFLSVAGAVTNPCTLRVPVGVTLRACVAAAGGATVPDPHYMVGGVMMGRLEDDHDALVDKTTGGLVVLPGDHVVIRRRRQTFPQIERIGRSACDQCSFCTELCPRYLLGHPIEPHKAMRSLMFNLVGHANVQGTSFCCECNLCSMFACPEDLDPKNVCAENKRRIAADGNRWTDPPFNPDRPGMHMDGRKLPMRKLMLRLGLERYNNIGPLVPELLRADRVGVRLKQHAGPPCEATVAPGERVEAGQEVGRPPVVDGRPALGAPVHASIPGTVTAVRNGVVWIGRG